MTDRKDSGMCFLLVEDEPPLRNALARSLTARGHEVDQVATVREAVDAALAREYDLLLLDVNLPDATGWDVLRQMNDAGRTVPAVVFSAVSPSAQRIREFRPLGVLTKPFPIDALLRFVHMVEKNKQP